MERPRIAVTSCWTPGSEEETEENLFCAIEPVVPENEPLRRKMADGLSFESIPNSWKPFPGQKKCTAAPNPSGKGTVPSRNTHTWLIVLAFGISK